MMQDEILEVITKRYFESGDFNGYPVSSIKKKYNLSNEQTKQLIFELIADRKLDAAFDKFHPNPHIKAFSYITSEIQLETLDELDTCDGFCLYPSQEVLSGLPEIDSFQGSPYKMELALGAGQLDFRVFDLSVLEFYRNDPRYSYHTDFIEGKIEIHSDHYESDSVAEHDQILLQPFGFALDDDLNRAVAVFLRNLSKLSPEHQRIWETRSLTGDYRLHPGYVQKYILAEWGTHVSIFEAFIDELAIINEMSVLMGKPPLFRETYSENKPKEFGFLLRPTLAEFNNFVMLLDKMMSDNINKKFFKDDLSLEVENERNDGKITVAPKGTIRLLEEWVRKYFQPSDQELLNDMFSTFRKVRKLRQPPAHAVNEDTFDPEYPKKQRQLIIDAYDAIYTIRLIFANHPKVRENPPNIHEYLIKGDIWDF